MANSEDVSNPSELLLWFGMLGGAGAWALHLLVSYPLVPFVCRTGGTALLLVISVVLMGVVIASGVLAWTLRRRILGTTSDAVATRESRRGFMASFGLVANLLFLLAVIMATAPILFIDPCL